MRAYRPAAHAGRGRYLVDSPGGGPIRFKRGHFPCRSESADFDPQAGLCVQPLGGPFQCNLPASRNSRTTGKGFDVRNRRSCEERATGTRCAAVRSVADRADRSRCDGCLGRQCRSDRRSPAAAPRGAVAGGRAPFAVFRSTVRKRRSRPTEPRRPAGHEQADVDGNVRGLGSRARERSEGADPVRR